MESAHVMQLVPAKTHQATAHVKMDANATAHHAAELFVNAMIAKNAVVITAPVQQETVLASANPNPNAK
jgi:hypothetical protein